MTAAYRIIPLLTGVAGLFPFGSPVTDQQTAELAFVDVNLVSLDADTALAHMTVLVRGDKILAVGRAATVKAGRGAVTIDGRGKYLMPGLVDMHVHEIWADTAPTRSSIFAARWRRESGWARPSTRAATGSTATRRTGPSTP